ncbi:MAG: hypothetical protein WC856_23555 [Methylococcaceae bacterium]|jgi:hypothetical protein
MYAITSTMGGNGDHGAEKNKLVIIVDDLSAATCPANESFETLRTTDFVKVLCGVLFTPGTTD